jgi:MFS family permease
MQTNTPINMRKLLIPIETEKVETREADLLPPTGLPRPMPPPTSRIIFFLALADLLLHFVGSDRYGFFRDELYYIACGNHLAFGYVDQPPLIALVARLSSLALGTTLSDFRFLPALAGACLVLLTGWTTRELGGGRFAQALAGLTVLLAPVYLAFGSFLSMNAFEPLFWMTCAYILIRILKGGDERLWLLFGAVAGIGLQNKHTMLMFGFAVAIGLILTRDWKHMQTSWFWLGGLLALVIFLPNLIWEAQHNWPQIEVVRNAQKLKNTPVGVLRFFGEQILFLNPVALPVIGAGLAWLFLSKKEKRFRALGWAFLVVIAVVMTLGGKTYYPLPFYPILIAAGGVGFGTLLLGNRKWLRLAYLAMLVGSGLIMLPFGVPVLPLETLLRYQNVIPLEKVVKMERDSGGDLHQLYADMFGWESMAATIANVYHSLPPSDQAQCAILAGNYGEAGAIDFFGAKYGLPKAISGHNNYYLWGTHGYKGEVVILFGQHAESTKTMFGAVEQVATISNPYAVAAENHLPVYVCRRPKVPLAQLWPTLRYFE